MEYQDDRKELRIDKEIYINGNIYEIEEDDLIFKRENNTTKISYFLLVLIMETVYIAKRERGLFISPRFFWP